MNGQTGMGPWGPVQNKNELPSGSTIIMNFRMILAEHPSKSRAFCDCTNTCLLS